jgi:hypothetical protein
VTIELQEIAQAKHPVYEAGVVLAWRTGVSIKRPFQESLPCSRRPRFARA